MKRIIDRRYRRGLIVSVIIVVVIGLLLIKPFVTQRLNHWRLLPEHERFTELYFTHPDSLPGYYLPGLAQSLSFTTHDLEYRTTVYDYAIIEQSADRSQAVVLDNGTFTLHQNQYKTVTHALKFTDVGQRIKITVQLTNTHESIAYWLQKSS
jgi:hypothetical protein